MSASGSARATVCPGPAAASRRDVGDDFDRLYTERRAAFEQNAEEIAFILKTTILPPLVVDV
jgi:hypothetical protein